MAAVTIIDLTPLDLALAAVLVLALAATSTWLRLGLGRQLIVSGIRTAVQLLLVGLLLKVVFDADRLLWVALMAGVMLAVAGREVMRRQRRRFAGPWGYALGTVSMFISAFSVTVLALVAVVGTHPWWEPQYAIPLLGMMLGNTMNGVSLALDRLTAAAWDRRDVIEARLALGETPVRATAGMRREAVRVGLTPIINAMAAAGIVSLPGMMTGQILAGAPPWTAVKYQVLIMFMIAGGTGFATLAAVALGTRRLFDARERLRLERLSHG